MGFFDRLSGSKYRIIGEKIASLLINMSNHAVINKLLTECNFSPIEKIRFRFDFLLASFCVVANAIKSVVQEADKADKIARGIYTILDGYLNKIIPNKIRIGDFIANDDEWDYLTNNHNIDDPNMITDYRRLFQLIIIYRSERNEEAFHAGFDLFEAFEFAERYIFAGRNVPSIEQDILSATSPLAERFVFNFPTHENNTQHIIETLSAFFALIYSNIREYCQKNT